MANNTIVGTGYVQIVPTTKGFSQAVNSEMESAGGSGGHSFAKGFGNVIGGVSKLAIGAVGAGATAAGKLVQTSVSAFGDYEQLVGGIETLFGVGGKSLEEYARETGMSLEEAQWHWEGYQSAQEAVLQHANEAYKTAGLSANEYMETVTSFSASLIQSLGGDTEQAAEYADMAIIDMADNANKMGTDISSIQTAYSGFAKQNYTMLDNLKLGYGGTKEEMKRLLEDAGKLNDVEYDISSYEDIIEAIHVVQENLGIAGATAQEASTTIQGSASAMSAAWQNVLTGMGNSDADMGKLIDELVQSALTFLDNLLPVIEESLGGLADIVKEVAPIIAKELPTLVNDLLPDLLETGVQVITEIINGLVQAIPTLLPLLIDAGIQIIVALAQALITNAPQLIAMIPVIFELLKQKFIELLPLIKEVGSRLIEFLKNAIETAWVKITGAVRGWMDNLKNKFLETVAKFKDIGKNIVDGIKNGIADGWNALTGFVKEKAESLLKSAKEALGIHSPSRLFADIIGENIPAGIAMGIRNGMSVLNSAIDDMTFGAITLSENDAIRGRNALATSGMGANGNGLNQTVNIYSPTALTPSEVARQTRIATQNMVLAMRGV